MPQSVRVLCVQLDMSNYLYQNAAYLRTRLAALELDLTSQQFSQTADSSTLPSPTHSLSLTASSSSFGGGTGDVAAGQQQQQQLGALELLLLRLYSRLARLTANEPRYSVRKGALQNLFQALQLHTPLLNDCDRSPAAAASDAEADASESDAKERPRSVWSVLLSKVRAFGCCIVPPFSTNCRTCVYSSEFEYEYS